MAHQPGLMSAPQLPSHCVRKLHAKRRRARTLSLRRDVSSAGHAAPCRAPTAEPLVELRSFSNGDAGALVEIMADVDPASPAPLMTWMVDVDIKRHVLLTAQRLRLRKAEFCQP